MTTNSESRTAEEEVSGFQQFLDRCFPIGALCVEFVDDDGRLLTTGVELVTGRVLCTGARRNGGSGWRHRILIDPRRHTAGQAEGLEAWVTSLRRHHEVSDLWEASVASDGSEDRVLRLLSNPEPPWRPTPAMRKAVSKAHGVPA